MSVDDLMSVASYNRWWLICGAILAAALVTWFILLPILTKKKYNRDNPPPAQVGPLAPGLMDPVRAKYRTLIAELADRHGRGEIDSRELHLALSSTLREYVKIRMGVRADTMTLTDLQRQGQATASVAKVIERCYHPAFGQDPALVPASGPATSLTVTVHEALQVVDSI